jgi:phosphomannomutase
MINKSIFKSYDVRGICPQELTEEAAFAIGKAFIDHTGSKNVVVCQDARLSSPALFKALVAGILAKGVQVTSVGQMPTECLYFALANYDFDAGIMITASHNPKEYNGFKMITKAGKDLTIIRGVDLLSKIQEGEFQENITPIVQKDILEDYKNYIFKLFNLDTIKKYNIAIDTSNGVMGNILSQISLPVTITPINFEPDGNFPNHAPNPLEPGSSDQIKEIIKKQALDFGFMFDGDADRIFLVDENGAMVPADAVLILLAKYFLQKNPGAGIAYNAVCSKAVPEFVKKWGGVPVRTQVGAVNVRDGLLKNNGVVGGEISAHYCFSDYFYMDSGLVAMLTILQIISDDGRKVSEIMKEVLPYAKGDANFKVTNKGEVMQKIQEKYADGKQNFLDGITVEYQDWWFNVRPSNTEPLLRLTIEANTREILDEKKQELSDFINN